MSAIAAQEKKLDPVRLARKRLYSAVLSDVMDVLGLSNQIMASQIRPVDESHVLCGRARTGDYKDVYHADEDSDPYALVVAFVDSLQEDDVVVLACGRSGRIHPWGGTLSTAASMRGAAGCVADGYIRDVRQIRALEFPAFGAGYGAMKLRGRGRLVATDVPVQCGGVWVSPGDLVFGDVDGVIVVPRQVEDQVIEMALEKADREREMEESIRAGTSLSEVYRRLRTL